MENKPFITLMLVTLGATGATAQESAYLWDAGAALGMSGYIGDAGHSICKHPGVSADVSVSYTPNVRWAFGAHAGYTTLSGNTAHWSNALPLPEPYRFDSRVYSLEARAEFNFLPFGIGASYQHLSRWSPYLTAGLGIALADCSGTSVAPTLPLGAGLKYQATARLKLSVEFTMTKVLSDRVDGLDDPIGIKSSFFKNTDWYSRLALSVSYAWGERCPTCHYVD